MEKKYIIFILLIIFLIVIFSVNCNENFESIINYKPLITNISDKQYCININNNEKIILTNFNEKSDCAKIYELYNIKNEKIYNIYLNDKILRYTIEKNINFVNTKSSTIASFYDYFNLYKTSSNKLYYIDNNKNRYLALDKENNKNIILSDKEEDGIIWILN
jgi:hypothetical protein